MAYTYGKSSPKETDEYWNLWNKKNRNVEKHFLKKWDCQFKEIREICKGIEKPENKTFPNFDHEEPYYAEYIGQVFSVIPSGKFYMPFASSNVSVKEAAIDMLWFEKFEEILDEAECWHESGEGSGTDMFICKSYTPPPKPPIEHDDFVRILSEIINEDLTAADLLAIPGIYEILAEYYNNDVLDKYKGE